MTRKQPPMRTLHSADSIRIGDVIRISGTIIDLQIVRVGTVAKREHSQMGVDYLTNGGMSLLTVFRDGTSGLGSLKIQLLNSAPDVALFELDA